MKKNVLSRRIRLYLFFLSNKNLLIMKLIMVFLLSMVFQIQANTLAQTITIEKKEMAFVDLLREIKRQTGYTIICNSDIVKDTEVSNVQLKNIPLEKALDFLLTPKNLSYYVEGKAIVVKRKSKSSASEIQFIDEKSVQQSRTLQGRVTDSLGNSLIGAAVSVKGYNLNTVTNSEGYFNIPKFPSGATLIISYVGYAKREIIIDKEQHTVSIVLRGMQNAIDEVIVQTGYQSLSKRELASSISQIQMKDIELQSQFSVDQMLAGQIPGLMALRTSGEPGATPKIRIRGTSSIIGGSAPLWVLDGIILEDPVNVDVSNLTSPDAQYLIGNSIAGINARDIEMITVLKDASATAIYGSRAANGVIVVTTKKGRTGKSQINYAGSVSLSQKPSANSLDLMTAAERIQLSQQIIADGIKYARTPLNLGYEGLLLDYNNKILSYDEFTAAVQQMANRNTDWYDVLFRNSITNNQAINLSGGTDRTTYYASMGYTDNLGTAKGSDQTRYTGMFKLNSWINDRLYVGAQLNASNTKGNGFHTSVNPNIYAYQTARTIPAYNDDGSLFYYETRQRSELSNADGSYAMEEMRYNILHEMQHTGADANTSNITAQLNLEYKLPKGIRYRLLGGFDQSRSIATTWAEESSNYVSLLRGWNSTLSPNDEHYDSSRIPWGGILGSNDQRKDSYTLRNSLEFGKSFNRHLVNIYAAQEIRSVKYKGLDAVYYGWQPDRGQTIQPALTSAYIGILDGLTPTVTDNTVNTASWIGTATYSYEDKYTFNANIRADGSNNFGDNPKYRFLPIWSIAGKYTLTNEDFMRNVPALSYFAIRGSYGIQGNIDKSSSPDLIIRVGSRNANTGLNESYFQYLPNPDLRWEKTTSYNIGLDFALFGRSGGRQLDIVSATIDMYNKKGTDIIVNRRVSQVIGLDQVKVNGGRINNKGVEGSLSIVPYQKQDFNLSLRFIISYNKNMLVEANSNIDISNNDKLNGNALIEGRPIGGFYSYRFAGLNADYGYPMFYNKDNELRYELYNDEVDLAYSGVPEPNLTGGFDISARYKRLYLSLGFQYAKGGTGRLPDFYRRNYYSVFDPTANVSKEIMGRWRRPGDEALTNIPVLYDADTYSKARAALGAPTLTGTSTTPLSMYDLSDLRTASTDNIRLRNLNVAYMIEPRLCRILHIETASINFQAENLFLLADSRWGGRDPESGASNTPLPKVYTLGVNIGF